MAVAWPSGVPSKILRAGASNAAPEVAIRSQTDSGLARQRAVFTAAPDVWSGAIRMTYAQYVTFKAWRAGLGGAVFDWPGHPGGSTVAARFIAGQQGAAAPDQATPKWLVPVMIEVLP